MGRDCNRKGFVRKNTTFSQLVNDLLNELQINIEAPPSTRNDHDTNAEEM